MLRSTLKFPNQGLARFQRHGNSRHLSVRYLQLRKAYSTESYGGRSGGGGGKAVFYTVGVVSLAAGGTIAYAKYDPEFRKLLVTQAPWVDTVIKIVLQEEETWNEKVSGAVGKVTSAVETVSGAVDKVQEGYRNLLGFDKKPDEIIPPAPKTDEIKIEDLQMKEKSVEEKPKMKPRVSSEKPAEVLTSVSITDLEKEISESALVAVKAYNEAVSTVRAKHSEIMKLIEQTDEGTDEKVWQKLKVSSEQNEKSLQEAEEKALVAITNVNKLKEILEDSRVQAPEQLKLAVVNNVARVTDQVTKAQAELAEEKRKSSLANRYWKKVYEARQHYLDEIHILFPDFRISEKEWNVSRNDLDLFIYHCYRNVLYYQKELARLETFGSERLRKAVRKSGEHVDKELIDALVAEQIDHQRRALEVEFLKRRLEVERTVEKELKHQLKRQSEAHSDHLNDALSIREKELEREFIRRENELLSTEQDKFKYELAGMMGRLKGLEATLKARAHVDKAAHQAQALWSACQALHFSIKRHEPGVPWDDQLQPLDKEIKAVKKAALEDDELVKAVLGGIPIEAMCRGVYSEAALRERFLKVERMARHLALVPDDGAALPVYLVSCLQGFLLIKSANPIPQSEIRDEPTDTSCLDTYDVLQRARYWMERGNIDQTLRYMHLLKGASRIIASDWMNEARIFLETKQAANVLMTHAAACGLVYI